MRKFETLQAAIAFYGGINAVPMNWNINIFMVDEQKHKILVCAKPHEKGEKKYVIGDYYVFTL